MVYKKYIKRNGKIFGPYIYESYRVGNKVLTRYVGQGKEEKSNKKSRVTSYFSMRVFLFSVLVLIGFSFLFFNLLAPTGKVSLELNNLEAGEQVTGNLKLLLKQGELIPSSSIVKIKLNEQEKTISLSELVSDNAINGSFYVEGKSISGIGEGYGLLGENSGEISFSLLISQQAEIGEQNQTQITNETEQITEMPSETLEEQLPQQEETPTEQPAEETSSEETEIPTQTPEQPAEETPTEQPAETPEQPIEETSPEVPAETPTEQPAETPYGSITGQAIGEKEKSKKGFLTKIYSQLLGFFRITGNVIEEESRTIEGSVSRGNDFTYNFNENETASIVSGSVKINSNVINDNSISLTREGNTARVTTDYSNEGFGHEYLGNENKEISINLNSLNISAERGSLEISLLYNNEEIIKETTAINIESNLTQANLTEIEQNLSLMNATNITQTNITIENITLQLIKPIEDITIRKNSNYSLNLSEYFVNAESYSVFETENISMSIENEKVAIVPAENYTGTSFGKISAIRGNETLDSEFNIVVSDSNITILTEQGMARLGQKVRWKKRIEMETADSITLTLPKIAENISVYKIRQERIENNIREERIKTETGITERTSQKQGSNIATINNARITGNLALSIDLNKKKEGILTRLYKNLIKLTGRAISEEETATEEIKELDIVPEEANITDYEIEYETPAPTASEIRTEKGKKEIIMQSDVAYEDITAFTFIEESKPENIIINGANNTNLVDYNNDGKIDSVEWTANIGQEVSIEIAKEEDNIVERSAFSDVYELGNGQKQGVYSSKQKNVLVNGSYVPITTNLDMYSDYNNKIVIDDGNINLELKPYYYSNNEKIYLENASLTNSIPHTHIYDNENSYKYAFGIFNFSQLNADKIGFDISSNSEVQASGNILTLGNIQIDFSDIASQYALILTSTNIEVSGTFGNELWLDPTVTYIPNSTAGMQGWWETTQSTTALWGWGDVDQNAYISAAMNNISSSDGVLYSIFLNILADDSGRLGQRFVFNISQNIGDITEINIYGTICASSDGDVSADHRLYIGNVTSKTWKELANQISLNGCYDIPGNSLSTGISNYINSTASSNLVYVLSNLVANSGPAGGNTIHSVDSIFLNITYSDTTPPGISITSPLNQTYNISVIGFNISSNENMSFCVVSLDNFASNYTMTLNASLTGANYTNNSIADGSYTAKYWCNDSFGNVNNSQTISFSIDTTKPILTNISSSAACNSANISWNTNENANSTIFYGTTQATTSNITNTTLKTNHSFNLTSLLSSTLYYYNVSSCDSVGNCNVSSQYNFTTSSCDATPPNINITSPLNQTYNSCSMNFSISANENLSYGVVSLNNWTTNYTMSLNASLTGANYTNTSIGNGGYRTRIWFNDSFGNVNNSQQVDFSVNVDSTPPNMTNITNSSLTSSSAIITFNTSEYTNFTIYYGTTQATLLSLSNSSNRTSHSITLTGLSASTTYYYNLTSCDFATNCQGTTNCNTSIQYNFTTPAAETTNQTGTTGSGGGGGTYTPPIPCIDECSANEKSCDGSRIKERSCGNYDADACNEYNAWKYTDCGRGEKCFNGVCVGCIENWTCTPFSLCNSHVKNRTCIDKADCGTTIFKPNETEFCNRKPFIERYSPGSLNLTAGFGIRTFSILANDLDNDILTIKWLFENSTLKEEQARNSSYSFNINGNALLGVSVNDGYDQTGLVWDIKITNETCKDEWNCGDWSNCTGEIKTRVCEKMNNCPLNVNKPNEELKDENCMREEEEKKHEEEISRSEDVIGEIKKEEKLKKECVPKIECSNWLDCMIDYNFAEIVEGKQKFEGKQERVCNDKNKCENTKIEKKECFLFIPIETNKSEKCLDDNAVELYEQDTNKLTGKIIDKNEKIDISFSIDEKDYCRHCSDKKKNYDEDAIDCGGISCSPCIENITIENFTLQLIKPIEDITIRKNENIILNLTDYFSGAESYSAFGTENVSFIFDNKLVSIVPAENYTGTSFGKISAIAGNETLDSEFSIIVSEGNMTIETIQGNARINEPVVWEKRIEIENAGEVKIAIPNEAENIEVSKIEEGSEEQVQLVQAEEFNIEENTITGEVVSDIENNHISEKLTGRAISITEKANEKIKEIIVKEENATGIKINYTTTAPYSVEENITRTRKIIRIFGPDNIHYTNVSAYSYLNKEVKKNRVKLYWFVNGTKKEVNITKFDLNNNSLVDYIEWQVPSLSEQVYELSISLLDVYSLPILNNNWTILFNTTGNADLIIEGINNTRWDNQSENTSLYDLRLLELKCGNVKQNYNWTNNTLLISNYSCNYTGKLTSKMLVLKEHNLLFRFGSEQVIAVNNASGLQAGLVAYYKFEGNATDYSGYDNHGSLLGGVNCTAPGINGSGCLFDGVNDVVSLGAFSVLNEANPFTISVWKKYNGGLAQKIWGIGSATAKDSHWLGYNDGGTQLTANIGNGSAWASVNTGNNSCRGTEWGHIVYQYDGSNLVIYCNGMKISSSTLIGKPTDASGFRIGSLGNEIQNFNGTIDEVRIYNKALNDTEIKKLYDEFAPKDVNKTELVAYYKFEGNATDYSGYDNHGSLLGGVNCTALGINGSGCLFDGVNDYVNLGNRPVLDNITDEITISAWVNVKGITNNTYEGIVWKMNPYDSNQGTAYGLTLYWTTSAFEFFATTPYTTGGGFVSQSQLPLNTWQHVTATYNSKTNETRLYFNGVLDKMNSVNIKGKINITDRPVYIGTRAGFWFNGSIDEVKIFNKALNDTEIKKLYDEHAPKPVVNKTELVAYYKFEGNATDYSGYDNHGSLLNGVNCTAVGINGSGCLFDGVNDYVDVSASLSFNLRNAFTLSAWIKTINSSGIILSHRSAASNDNKQYQLQLTKGKSAVVFQNDSAGDNDYGINSLTNVNDSKWHLITGTFNGTSGKIYIDGIEENNTGIMAPLDDNINVPLFIGRQPPSGSGWFTGMMDEMRVYNKALNDTEIKKLYEQFAPKSVVNKTELVAYYKFEGNATDYSGYDNHGSLLGGVNCTAPGINGSGCLFDGVNDVVSLGAFSVLNEANPFTISLWKKYNGGLAQKIWGSGSATAKDSHWLGYNDGGNQLTANIGNGSAWASVNTGNNSCRGTEWGHIVYQYDGSNLVIYCNGMKISSSTLIGKPTDASGFRIGSLGNEIQNFNGTIDEVRIYNKALNDTEIKKLYDEFALKDITPPSISITSPLNQTYNTNSINFSVLSDEDLSYCVVSLNNFASNYTMTLNASLTGANYTNTSIADAGYTAKYWCNDTSGNVNNSQQITFLIDTIPLQIKTNVLLKKSENTNGLEFYAQSNKKLKLSKISLNNWATNYTMSLNDLLTEANYTNTSIADGSYNAKFWFSDTAGNVNDTEEIMFIIDTMPPNISIIYPQNRTYTANISELNYTIEDANLQACWYSTNNGTTNYSITCGENMTNLTSNYGTNIWQVYANDSAGNIGWSFVTFFLSSSLSAVPGDLSLPVGSGSSGSSSSGGSGVGGASADGAGNQLIIVGSSFISCSDECKENEEQKYCEENKIITKTCGNYDNDRCLEFNISENHCNENEKCERGMCVRTEEEKAGIINAIGNYAGKTAEIIKIYKKQISISLSLITLSLVIIVSVIYLMRKKKSTLIKKR